MHPRLLGVVLCGGLSSRMGRDKSRLPHPDGGTFLEHSVERLESICDAVVVSGTSNTEGTDKFIIEDPIAHQGPAAGVAAALDYARKNLFAACLVTPVDTPFLSANDVERLKQRWLDGGGLTLAQSDRIEPLIGIYPADLADELARLAASDKRSLYRWIESQVHDSVKLPEKSCQNINTPEDLGG